MSHKKRALHNTDPPAEPNDWSGYDIFRPSHDEILQRALKELKDEFAKLRRERNSKEHKMLDAQA